MKLLPKPKKTEQTSGFYELGWKSVIIIDRNLGENATVYAAVLQDGLRESTGINVP